VSFEYEGGAPATFGSLYWSFLDVGNTETLMVYGPKSLFTYEQGVHIQKTEFNANSAATCGSDYGCTGRYVRFVATNTGMPQPEDPLKLNSMQIASSIQLLLTNVHEFDLYLGSHLTQTDKGCCQTFFFAGESNVNERCDEAPPSPPVVLGECDYSLAACEEAANRLGLAAGGCPSSDFAKVSYATKGCYGYSSGAFAGCLYYGLIADSSGPIVDGSGVRGREVEGPHELGPLLCGDAKAPCSGTSTKVRPAGDTYPANCNTCTAEHMVLDWSKARIKYNNFGGYGRHSSHPHELRFEGFGKHNGKDVEVVLKHSTTRGSDQFSTEDTGVTQDMSTKCNYNANDEKREPCFGEDAIGTGTSTAKFGDRADGSGWGYFGSLSIGKGTRNDLFVDVSFEYADGTPATFGSLYWSFLDVGNTERLVVYGGANLFTYFAGDNIAVDVQYEEGMRKVVFDATDVGMPQPHDPLELNDNQIASTVQLRLTNVHSFEIYLGKTRLGPGACDARSPQLTPRSSLLSRVAPQHHV
jgi:hypothetical protein